MLFRSRRWQATIWPTTRPVIQPMLSQPPNRPIPTTATALTPPARELTHPSDGSSKLPPVIFALSTTHEIALATMGGIFIVFSIISAFVIPAKNPNFPGKGLPIYLVISVVLFLAMMSTVLIFGKESKKAEAQPAAAASTAASTGDATNGKTVFTANGCGACHTLKDAGAAGMVDQIGRAHV